MRAKGSAACTGVDERQEPDKGAAGTEERDLAKALSNKEIQKDWNETVWQGLRSGSVVEFKAAAGTLTL